MQGLILAAGMGKRLKELTKNNTKCMVKVNGITLIERVLKQLEQYHFSRIVIVVGYEGQKLIDYINTLRISTPICYVNNPIFDKTNNIYSLALAKEYLLEDDTILLESDIIFEDDVLKMLIDDPRETLAVVDKYESWMDGTCIKIGEDDTIESFVPGKKLKFEDTSLYFKTVNIYKFSKHFSETHYVPFLQAYSKALGNNEYYEQVLRVITMLDEPEIKAKRLNGQSWYEIDDIQDLDIAESMFAEDMEQRANLLQERYGGYWRYPKLKDFCYLVNPYFPPERLINEMKASFGTLLIQYPSGIKVNSLLAAKNFGVDQENILVGNGAAELIKSLMDSLSGKVGIIRPTFEEYSHRYEEKEIISFWPENKDFQYTAEDIIGFFTENPINNLVLINPDNPSGNYLPNADLIKLVAWTKERSIKFILDESFADFSDELDNTMIKTEILKDNPHLYVIKSISKSYGVPGLRLGVFASGDEETIIKLKKDVAIWNINSFAEFYMQILGKYLNDYNFALETFRKERKRYLIGLKEIKGLRVIPTQANYVMAEITGNMTAAELSQILLVKYNILIKNLSSKIHREGKQYIRLAVKTTEENDKIISALKDIM